MGQKKGAALKKAERFELASKGFWCLFLARLLTLAVRLITRLPLGELGAPLFDAGLFLACAVELYGLWAARASHPGFYKAFWTELIGAVVLGAAFIALMSWNLLAAIMVTILSTGLLALCVVWWLSAAAKDLLTQKGDHVWAKRADWFRWSYGCALALNIAFIEVAQIPALRESLTASFAGAARSVFDAALGLYFIFFCFRVSRSLRP